MTLYATGAARVEEGVRTVTGIGTTFATSAVAGGLFTMDGDAVPIASVESETALTLAQPWTAASRTGPYAILLSAAQAATATEILRRIQENVAALRNLSPLGRHITSIETAEAMRQLLGLQIGRFSVDASGPFAARAGYDERPAGFSFLATDRGLIYLREGAAGWSAGQAFGRGDDGREVILNVSASAIEWRYEDEAAWRILVPFSALTRDAEFGRSDTHIQWRLAGDAIWRDLVPLALIKGDQGDQAVSTQEAIAAAAAAASARQGAETARDTIDAKAAETLLAEARAKASADSAAALAAAFEIDPVRRTLVPPISVLTFETEVTPPGLVVVRSTAAVRVNRLGRLESVAANALRHDYDPVTGAYRGALIGGQRANLCRWSEALESTDWGKGNTAITQNATVAPDGNATADKIVENTAANAPHFVQLQNNNNLALTAGQTATFSIYVKAAERKAFILRMDASSTCFSPSESKQASFSLLTGVIAGTLGSGVTYFCTDEGNGWWRIGLTVTATAAGVLRPLLMLAVTSPGSFAYSGDGASGLYAWGGQSEIGAFPTSYIKTEGDAVTRTADLLNRPVEADFNLAAGSVFLRARSARGAGANQNLWQIDDGSTANRILLRRNDNRDLYLYVVVAGVAVAFLNLGVLADDTDFAVAAAWRGNDFAASLNGAAPVTRQAGGLPAALSVERIGSSIGVEAWGGTIGRSARWPRRLPNADLQAITRRAA